MFSMHRLAIPALFCAIPLCLSAQTTKYKAAWANSPDCPVKILGAGVVVNGTQADIFGNVTLANASSRQVAKVQLAWSIEAGEGSLLVFGFGPIMQPDIAPGDAVAAGAQGADATAIFKTLGATAGTGTVTRSVVSAQFGDGTEWRRAMDQKAAFRNEESPKAYERFEEKHRQIILEMQVGPPNRAASKCRTPKEAEALVAQAARVLAGLPGAVLLRL
jgi:hypothetical protein